MFRSAFLILSGNAAASLLLLARNLIVARLIPVADYGVAATFAIAMAVVEMMSALGLQQQIVQAKNGEDPRFQAALQGFQVLRGILAGATLVLLAGPIADFLNVPEAAWAYRVMALVPVLNALTHFDVYRLNRSMVFWPVILTGAVPAFVSVLALWPLAQWYGDYRVMLWAIVVQATLTAAVSHLVARRPYRLVLDRAIMTDSLRFGWPLLIDGILLFAVFQGDKVIVGREMGMETLAVFAMGFTLTLTPTLVISKSTQNFFLPQLSSLLGDDSGNAKADVETIATAAIQSSMLMGFGLVLMIYLFGEILVMTVLGAKYESLLSFLTLLAIVQAIRSFRTSYSTISISHGYSIHTIYPNLVRVLLLPVAWYFLQSGAGLLSVIYIAIIGEIAGFIISNLLIRRYCPISSWYILWPTTTTCSAILLLLVTQNTGYFMIFFAAVATLIASMGYRQLLRYVATQMNIASP